MTTVSSLSCSSSFTGVTAIVTVVEPGYVLNGRVVRPAKVVVSRGGTAAQAEDL